MPFAATPGELCHQLAQLVVRDGKGAALLIEIAVTGAEGDRSAHRNAMAHGGGATIRSWL